MKKKSFASFMEVKIVKGSLNFHSVSAREGFSD